MARFFAKSCGEIYMEKSNVEKKNVEFIDRRYSSVISLSDTDNALV